MHIMMNPKKVLASAVISELQSSDMYLTLVARLFDLRANLNGVRVTEAFLDEIVENESRYLCHPLYADIRGLLANKTVGHMYNARTGEFYSTQIGAFYHFEKEVDSDNAYLLGYARVPKRNKALCKVLSDLFADNALKFSFEVNCGFYFEEADGTLLIDADERNYWEGECIVTFPACETAIAKQLVAECLSKGDEDIVDTKILTSETAQAVIDEHETMVAEVVEEKESASTETATAETIYVTQEHTEVDRVSAYNTDTGESTEQCVVVETTVHTPIELAETENDDESKKETEEKDKCTAEASDTETEIVAESENDEEDEEVDEEEIDEKKEVAENTSDLNKIVAELFDAINTLRNEIAELKIASIAENKPCSELESATVIAETAEVKATEEPIMNPFMASISAPQKYSLLNREEKSVHKYSLLERA